MDPINGDGPPDPRHVFLDAGDVMRRYDWGKTKGYQNLKNRELVPPPVMTHAAAGASTSSWRGAERRMAMAEAALEALVASDREPDSVTDLLPQPKRRRRSA